MNIADRSGNIQFGGAMGGSGGRPVSQGPFRILVMGDFSGRQNRGICDPSADRKPLSVDVDSIETRLEKLNVALALNMPGADEPLNLTFKELEDLHPDRIYAQTAVFDELKQLRRRLLDPATFPEAAAQIKSWADTPAPPQPDPVPQPEPEVGADQAAESGADLMGSLLDKPVTPSKESARVVGSPAVDKFIKNIVGPHIIDAPNPEAATLATAVDKAAAAQMGAILHHPDFQALESAWRGLDFLVRNLETDEALTLHFLDLSQEELVSSLTSGGGSINKVLVEDTVGTPGGMRWSLVTGLYTFGESETGRLCVRSLAEIAAKGGCAFVAGAEYVPGKTDEAPDTDAAAQFPGASRIALVAPRMLMRLPYGSDTEPVDCFDYEEMPDGPDQSRYLWGNAAVGCACLLGKAYTDFGDPLAVDAERDLDDLPIHIYKIDGERRTTQPGEYLLTDNQAENVAAHGITVLRAVKAQNIVRFEQIRSVANTALQV